jgi:dGTPase
MSGNGGFEGNGQTLRILTRLEKYSSSNGADLMRRTLLGTLKYPVAYRRAAHLEKRASLLTGPKVLRLVDREASKPPKCFMDSEQGAVDWILEPLSATDREAFEELKPLEREVHTEDAESKPEHRQAMHKSFDCSIMDLADDIAFGVHDLEDALALSLVTAEQFERYVAPEACSHFLDWRNSNQRGGRGNDVYGDIVKKLFGNAADRKHAISILVGYFVLHCTIDTLEQFEEPLIRYRAGMKAEARVLLKALKKLVYEVVIRSPSVQHLEFKGQQMVVAVFEALASEPKAFLPRGTFELYERDGGDVRVICDHVSGMTDGFLLKTYERLFSPRMGSVFDSI